MNASPLESPATQNLADGQDTDHKEYRIGPLSELAAFASMLTGAVQVLPSKVTMFRRCRRRRRRSRWSGRDTTGQEIPPSPHAETVGVSLDGPAPGAAVERERVPLRSMATPKLADAHDTACRWLPGRWADGLLQEVPLKVTTFGP